MPTANFIYYASGVCLITGVDHIAGGPLKSLVWQVDPIWNRGGDLTFINPIPSN